MFQQKMAEAEREFREALRLDPDDAESLLELADVCMRQGKWEEAASFLEQARRLSPTSAHVYAALGTIYAIQRDREKAEREIKEALRLDPEEINVELIALQVYDALQETALAVEHGEKFLMLARKDAPNSERFREIEKRVAELKAMLTPTYLTAAEPKSYTDKTLKEALRAKLTEAEFKTVVIPFASSTEMKRWAHELTGGAKTDMEKAMALFNGLTRRIPGDNEGGTRTAREVFAAWKKPEESFSCQEFAKLFIALGREMGIRAFYVHLERDYSGRVVYHDCAAVFADGKALLVDPAYRWFGPGHTEYVLLNDVQAVAHHYFQGGVLARCRIAEKLHPDFAWGKVARARALFEAEMYDAASKAIDSAEELQPGRWDTLLMRGLLDVKRGKMTAAAGFFRRALALNPTSAELHFYLANTLADTGQLREAREEYRACLQNQPRTIGMAEAARRHIVEINEKIGAA